MGCGTPSVRFAMVNGRLRAGYQLGEVGFWPIKRSVHWLMIFARRRRRLYMPLGPSLV